MAFPRLRPRPGDPEAPSFLRRDPRTVRPAAGRRPRRALAGLGALAGAALAAALVQRPPATRLPLESPAPPPAAEEPSAPADKASSPSPRALAPEGVTARGLVEALPLSAEASTAGQDVTALVSVEEHPGLTAFRLTGALAAVQVLDLDLGPSSVWVGTSAGLLRHDPRAGTWILWDATSGLPGERLDEVAVAGGRVFADTARPSGPHSVVGTGVFAFDPRSREWAPVRVEGGPWDLWGEGTTLWLGLGSGAEARDIERGGTRRFTREGGQLLHDAVHAVRAHRATVWFAMMGDWVKEREDFAGGGVTVWDREADRFRHYAPPDGLARAYSCDLAVDDDEVFVAHWDEERGLSRLDRRTGRWEARLRSSNGLDLGGVALAIEPGVLWVGQQRGLLRLERETGHATRVGEQDGLPGHIVSAIAVGKDAVWAGAYSYGRDGVRSAGLARFPRRSR